MCGYEDLCVSIHSPDVSRSKAFLFTCVHYVSYNDIDTNGITSYIVCYLTTMPLFPVLMLSKLAFVQIDFFFLVIMHFHGNVQFQFP